MLSKFIHPADQVLMMINRVYYSKYTTTSGGNISMMDEEGNIWITPSGVDKGTLTREDIVKVTPSGEIIGKHKPSMELPFHSMAMKVSGAKAILHGHPPALISISLLRDMPNVVDMGYFTEVVKKLSTSPYDVPGSVRLGEKISKVFAEGADAVMMDNHGIVVCADNLFEAFKKFEAMECAGKLEILANQLGEIVNVPEAKLKKLADLKADLKFGELSGATATECDIRASIVAFAKRSIKLGFFNSFQGAFAVRAENGFLTEPDKFDHEYITADDVVKIENGVAQKGTNPTRFAKIFEAVFAKHKDVGAVSVSSPTSAMAFAVTHVELDSKTIPESYIMMREVKRISLDDFLANPNIVAEFLCVKTPVVIVDNAFVFTAGVNLTKCFDSMEVTEFTAKNIIDGLSLKNVSSIKKISSEQVAELKREFNL